MNWLSVSWNVPKALSAIRFVLCFCELELLVARENGPPGTPCFMLASIFITEKKTILSLLMFLTCIIMNSHSDLDYGWNCLTKSCPSYKTGPITKINWHFSKFAITSNQKRPCGRLVLIVYWQWKCEDRKGRWKSKQIAILQTNLFVWSANFYQLQMIVFNGWMLIKATFQEDFCSVSFLIDLSKECRKFAL